MIRVPRVLVGLGGLLSDPACCVIKDGRLASAIEHAKVSGADRPGSFPAEAFELALESAGVKSSEIDGVAIATPFAEERESLAQLGMRVRFPKSDIVIVDHHHAHAASAYYATNFDAASVLSADRAGDFRSAVLFEGRGRLLTPVR